MKQKPRFDLCTVVATGIVIVIWILIAMAWRMK